jgi:hypothetical protein
MAIYVKSIGSFPSFGQTSPGLRALLSASRGAGEDLADDVATDEAWDLSVVDRMTGHLRASTA